MTSPGRSGTEGREKREGGKEGRKEGRGERVGVVRSVLLKVDVIARRSLGAAARSRGQSMKYLTIWISFCVRPHFS